MDNGIVWFNINTAAPMHLRMLEDGEITDQDFDHWFILVACVLLYEGNR